MQEGKRGTRKKEIVRKKTGGGGGGGGVEKKKKQIERVNRERGRNRDLFGFQEKETSTFSPSSL